MSAASSSFITWNATSYGIIGLSRRPSGVIARADRLDDVGFRPAADAALGIGREVRRDQPAAVGVAEAEPAAAEEVPHVVAGVEPRAVALPARPSRRVAVLADRHAHEIPAALGSAGSRRALGHCDVGERRRRRVRRVEAVLGQWLRHGPQRLHEGHDVAHVVGGHAAVEIGRHLELVREPPLIASSSTRSGKEFAGTLTLAECTRPHGPANGMPPAKRRSPSRCLPSGWRSVWHSWHAKIVVRYSPRAGSPFGSGVVSTRCEGGGAHAANVANASAASTAGSRAQISCVLFRMST